MKLKKLLVYAVPVIAFGLGFLLAVLINPKEDDCFGPKPEFNEEQYEAGYGKDELPPLALYRPDYAYNIDPNYKVDCKQLRKDCADEQAHMIRGKHIYEMRYECQLYMHECI